MMKMWTNKPAEIQSNKNVTMPVSMQDAILVSLSEQKLSGAIDVLLGFPDRYCPTLYKSLIVE